MNGSIYLIASPDQGAAKIGYAANTRERLMKAQTNNPSPLDLVYDFPGDRSLEGLIHRLLRERTSLHIRGDWFRYHDRLDLFMEELADASGAAEFDGEDPTITAAHVEKAADFWFGLDATLDENA
jgi:hypothetical protein